MELHPTSSSYSKTFCDMPVYALQSAGPRCVGGNESRCASMATVSKHCAKLMHRYFIPFHYIYTFYSSHLGSITVYMLTHNSSALYTFHTASFIHTSKNKDQILSHYIQILHTMFIHILHNCTRKIYIKM